METCYIDPGVIEVGRWEMGDGRWEVGDGRWEMRWEMGDER